ncbi:phosphatidate cytidylyltransferase [bacterium]|nr:phosphatidate cytidylyltransferase [bacterium]
MNMRELGFRLIVAGVGIPAILVCTLLGKIWMVIVVLIIETVALSEFYQLYKNKGFSPNIILGIGSVILMTLSVYLFQLKYIYPVIFIALTSCMICEMFRNKSHPIINIAITIFGWLYLSFFSSLILIRQFPKTAGFSHITGGWLVMQIFFTIWLCDTAAYFWGSKFGRHPLFKKISPKKTWEGAIAGFVVSVPSAIFIRFLFVPHTSLLHSIILGAIVGSFGQIGDLIESFIKRDAGVKDSSGLLPGHGGFLDRFDSPLIVTPLVYLSMRLFGIG